MKNFLDKSQNFKLCNGQQKKEKTCQQKFPQLLNFLPDPPTLYSFAKEIPSKTSQLYVVSVQSDDQT